MKKLYEMVTPSDPITFYAPDNDIAEAIAVFVGNGKAGLNAIDGSETPNTIIIAGVSDEQMDRIKATLKDRQEEVVAAGKTFATCTAEYREEYDKLTENSTNAEAIARFDDRHRSSMSDWCGYARSLTLKEKAKE